MALSTNPEGSRSVFDAIKGAMGLFSDTNKAQSAQLQSDINPQEEYESKLSEEEIIVLIRQWKGSYAQYYDPIEKSQELAFDYWIGSQSVEGEATTNKNHRLIDNQIFPALETFLPIATRANPDPVVDASDDPVGVDPKSGQPITGKDIAHAVKLALVHEADRQKLRRILARGTRNWAINRLGVFYIRWDPHTKLIKTTAINPKKIILDKDGYIDEGGNFCGEYIGYKQKTTGKKLSEMFPKHKEYIRELCQGKMGTKLDYFEWWYKSSDVFYTVEDKVLGKFKNPHWNYDGEEITKDLETGEEKKELIQGSNHFPERRSPFVFLSVFSTGLHPHDDTSLILQNVSLQDVVNKRWKQIDKNVESQNNGLVVSGRSFTEAQAAEAAAALRRGVAIRVPDGDVNNAIKRDSAPSLPRDIFQNLEDARNEVRNVFGTAGSTPEGTENQDTVRGKIMVSQQDSSRIGGGITEQIEQVADTIYNWWVQLMFVYFDEEHFILDSGADGGAKLISLKNSQFPLLKTLEVTVKEGSLIPKDPMTQRNEAVDLWSANAIDPLNFFKRLDYPDPVQATQQLILWQMFQKGMIPPQAYLPSFQLNPAFAPQQAPGAPQNPGQGGPSVSPPPNSPNPGAQPAEPQSQEAVGAQSKQLIQSVPIQ